MLCYSVVLESSIEKTTDSLPFLVSCSTDEIYVRDQKRRETQVTRTQFRSTVWIREGGEGEQEEHLVLSYSHFRDCDKRS